MASDVVSSSSATFFGEHSVFIHERLLYDTSRT